MYLNAYSTCCSFSCRFPKRWWQKALHIGKQNSTFSAISSFDDCVLQLTDGQKLWKGNVPILYVWKKITSYLWKEFNLLLENMSYFIHSKGCSTSRVYIPWWSIKNTDYTGMLQFYSTFILNIGSGLEQSCSMIDAFLFSS